METNVSLLCVVIGNPTPTITWQKRSSDGELTKISYEPDNNPKNGTLLLENVNLETSGYYICNASNKFGYKDYKTQVIIKPGI